MELRISCERFYIYWFEMWCCRRTQISWTDGVRNESVLHWVKKERDIQNTTHEGRVTEVVISCLVTVVVISCLVTVVVISCLVTVVVISCLVTVVVISCLVTVVVVSCLVTSGHILFGNCSGHILFSNCSGHILRQEDEKEDVNGYCMTFRKARLLYIENRKH